MNEHQQLTKYIKHLADSANFKAVTFSKKCSGLIGLFSEMRNDFLPPNVMPHAKKTDSVPNDRKND